MQLEEQRRPVCGQKGNGAFDCLVLKTFDIDLDEVWNDSEAAGRRLNGLNRNVDRLRSRPHRMIEAPALDKTADRIDQHAHRSRRFSDGDLIDLHSFAELI